MSSMRMLPVAGPLLILALLLLPSVHAQDDGAATEKPIVRARVVRNFALDGVLLEWGDAQPLVLGEKNVIRNATDLSRDWAGEGDLSAVFYVGFTATDLVLAGTVRDDDLILNPDMWWLGDEIEVFFDLDLDPDEKVKDKYTEDDLQMLLFPLAPERTWGFANFGKAGGKTDGGFDGVRTAAKRIESEEGYRGFTFEAAIPLVNYRGLRIRKGLTVGFDIALVDADGQFGQKSYLTWSGGSELSRNPSRFARLVFEEDLPPTATVPRERGMSWVEPVVILAVAVLLVLLLSRFRTWLAPLTELRLRTRLLGLVPVIALLVLAGLLPDLIRESRRDRQREGLERRRALLSEILDEARAEGLLGTPETGPDPDRIMRLLTGSAVTPPERYEYRPIFVREPALLTTLLRTPVIDYARALSADETADFVPPEPVEALGVAAVVHLEPDPAARRSIEPGEVVAVIRVFLENGAQESRDLRFGYEVSDYRLRTAETYLLPEAAIAWRDREAGTHADEVALTLPEAANVVRVEVEQTVLEATFVVHGVTLRPPEDADPVPLPLLTLTRIGVPTCLWRGLPSRAEVALDPGSEPITIALVPPVDQVWVFVARAGWPEGRPVRAGPDLVSLAFTREDGTTTEPVLLREGVHLWPEVSFSRVPEPRPGFRGAHAIRWTAPGDWARRRDAIALSADGPVVSLTAKHIGAKGRVLIAGVTQGRLIPHVPSRDLESFELEEGEYRLTAETALALAGADLTWYRDGSALRTTISVEGVVGSTLPRRSRDGPGDRKAEERRLGETEYLAAFLSLDRAGHDVVEIVVPNPDASDVEAVAVPVFFILLGLLLLGILLLLVDLLSRLPRIRLKLTLGFAVTAIVPLVLFFIGLSGVLEREVGRSEETTLQAQILQIRSKLEELPLETRKKAAALLSDPRLLHPIASADGTYEEQTDEALADIDKTASPFGGPARVFLEDAFEYADDAGPRTFPRGAGYHPLTSGGDLIDDLRYRWSRIVIGGVASTPVREGRRTIAVEMPIDTEVLEQLKTRFGRRTELLLFTLRGYPCAGTIEISSETNPEVMRNRRRALVEADLNRRPTIRREILAGAPHYVAYDVLRSGNGSPVALLGVALPRQEFIAARTELRNLFFVLAAVILVLEVVVGNILTRRLTGPLTSLSRGARAVAKGRFATRVEVEGSDEVAVLAVSFNRMTAELGRRVDELSGLNSALREFSGSLDRERVLTLAVAAFRDAASPPDGLVITTARDEEIRILAGFRGSQSLTPVAFPFTEGLLALALETESPEILTDLAENSVGDAPEAKTALGRPGSAVVVPFRSGRDERGAAVLLFDGKEPGLAPRDLEFLSALAQQVAIALETSRLYQLAIEDEGTDLYVHSYFASRLREETDRALAADRPLSVLLFSFGELTEINESRGEAEGNQLLSRVVRRLRAAMGGLQLMARADRDTVEVLLPETTKEGALEVAREIRSQLSRIMVPLGDAPGREIHVTPFLGIATCPDDARSAEFLLSEAQQALYVAVADGAGVVDSSEAREEIQARLLGDSGRYVFRSAEMIELIETVDRIALADVPILIRGETGVGKEVVAELVHEKSERRGKPLVKVNCAALPETLLESELFGYERGAFTGADRRKPGRFELAHGGTIFLDEIGEIPPSTQVKLLRVLQDHRIERLGGTGPIHVDVRVIAATNIDLPAAMREGRFREDLYFRLNVVSLVIPPLRARKEEIPAFVDRFVSTYTSSNETKGQRLGAAAMDRLFTHDWPGNVRELRNTIERALVIARGEEVQADEIVFPERAAAPVPDSPAPDAAKPSTRSPHPPLSDRQRRLLLILAARESITNREYAAMVGVSVRTGNRDMSELLEYGLIEQSGKRRAAVYRLASG